MKSHGIQVIAADRAASVAAEVVGGPANSPVSPFRVLHRNLKGRYRWAFVLGTLGLAAGAFGGWNAKAPLYRAEGIIYISPSMPSPQDPAGLNVLPMFKGFVAFQVQLLGSLSATLLAMETSAWQKAGEGMEPEAIEEFVERRSIVHVADTQHVKVQFVDPSPDVAVAGVRALIEAYEKLSSEENAKNKNLEYVATNTEVLTAQLKDGEDQILRISAEYGGVEGLELRHSASVTRVLATEEELAKNQSEIRSADAGGKVATAQTPKSPREIALESKQMADALLQLDLLEAKEKLMAETMGEKNEKLVAHRLEIEVRKKMIAQYVEDWDRSSSTGTKANQATLEGRKVRLDDLRVRESALNDRLKYLREESQKFGKARLDVGQLKAQNENLRRRLDQMKALKDQLSSQLVGRGRITIADEGKRPSSPFKDSRKSYAAVGGVLGGGMGVLIVLLFGLRNRRFRSTDDVGASLSRLRLLGLMPALPVDLLDPQGEEIAVHCVHQIRTLLHIGHAREESGCICVTGSGVGSGKTTLSLALGLSFGRSGSRTLLVDADLTGFGLTRRVGRMLLSHARRGAGEISAADGATSGTGGPSRSHDLIEPLVSRRSALDPSGPGELLELLSRSVERRGIEAVSASGLMNDLFALTDLLYHGEGRAELGAYLTHMLASKGPQEPSLPAIRIPPQIKELRTAHPEFNGDPLDSYLYPTGVESLRFLPLRGLGAAGGVSVATISNILNRVRGEFDIVLVDTGPLPGAVETPMVAARADAVVFVVSPDDSRVEAERAVVRLEEVGARIAGVVFNRAGPKDVIAASPSRSVAASGVYVK